MHRLEGEEKSMPLSPADVHNVAFSKPPIGKRGYNEDEVDQFLDLVEDTLAQLQDENDDLQAQVEELQTKGGATTGVAAASANKGADEATLRKEIESKLRAEYETKLVDSKNEVAKAKEEAKRAQEQAKTAQAEISKAPTGSNNDAELKAAREDAAKAKRELEAARAAVSYTHL